MCMNCLPAWIHTFRYTCIHTCRHKYIYVPHVYLVPPKAIKQKRVSDPQEEELLTHESSLRPLEMFFKEEEEEGQSKEGTRVPLPYHPALPPSLPMVPWDLA